MGRIIEEAPQPTNPIRSVHAWKPGESEGLPMLHILTHHSVYEAIIQQAEASLPNETGGFLLGYVGFDPDSGCWHNEIDEVLPIAPTDSNPIHFTFTWKDVDRVRTHREQEGKALIGWYHTHPGLGI